MSLKNQFILPAPAKINRFLHIIGRRTDGYHELQTLFQFLDYGDELVFEDCHTLELETSLPELQTDSNLVIRAAKLLQEKTGCSKGARIFLKKQLPMGGGVGGGSSNAATTLHGLNKLWALSLEENTLAELGLQLGADVPVFVRGKSAFAEGVGERLTAVYPYEPWYVVLEPDVQVNTIAMYGHKHLTRDTPAINLSDVLGLAGRNDFERLVRKLYPEVDNCLTLLDNFSHLSVGSAMLTGSGSCVFAPFTDSETAMHVLHELRSITKGFVAKGINQSPLHSVLYSKQGEFSCRK